MEFVIFSKFQRANKPFSSLTVQPSNGDIFVVKAAEGKGHYINYEKQNFHIFCLNPTTTMNKNV